MEGNRLTEKATLRKEIRDYIQQQIASGRFKAGDRIVETQMARELGKDFSICWAKLEDFRENVYGSLVLNIDEADREQVCNFLSSKKVAWEVLT